jgi:hypothetical protein
VNAGNRSLVFAALPVSDLMENNPLKYSEKLRVLSEGLVWIMDNYHIYSVTNYLMTLGGFCYTEKQEWPCLA